MADLKAYRPSLQRYMTGPMFKKQQISRWMYVTDHDVSVIFKAGYFDGIANIVKGDVIECVLGIDGTPELRLLVVKAVEDGAVTVTGLKT